MKKLNVLVMVLVEGLIASSNALAMGLSHPAKQWLGSALAQEVETAIERRDTMLLEKTLVQAYQNHRLNIDDPNFSRVLQGQIEAIPAEVLYLKVLAGMLRNDSNFSYVLLESIEKLPEAKKHTLIKDWHDRTQLNSQNRQSLWPLLRVDALMRAGQYKEADRLLESYEPHLGKLKNGEFEPAIISFFYLLHAETKLAQFYFGKHEDEKLFDRAKELYQRAAVMDVLAEAYVGYAFLKLSRNVNAPQLADVYAKKALSITPGNILALAILANNPAEKDFVASQRQYVQGTFTMSASIGLFGPKFSISWKTPDIKFGNFNLGGVAPLANEINSKSIKGARFIVSGRSYPLFLQITDMVNKGGTNE